MSESTDFDLTGQKFGKLLVLEKYRNRKDHWICKCDCGRIKAFPTRFLLKKEIVPSCGCYEMKNYKH